MLAKLKVCSNFPILYYLFSFSGLNMSPQSPSRQRYVATYAGKCDVQIVHLFVCGALLDQDGLANLSLTRWYCKSLTKCSLFFFSSPGLWTDLALPRSIQQLGIVRFCILLCTRGLLTFPILSFLFSFSGLKTSTRSPARQRYVVTYAGKYGVPFFVSSMHCLTMIG